MKKPIDPSLNDLDSDDLFLGKEEKSIFKSDDIEKYEKKDENPNFTVTLEENEKAQAEKGIITGAFIAPDEHKHSSSHSSHSHSHSHRSSYSHHHSSSSHRKSGSHHGSHESSRSKKKSKKKLPVALRVCIIILSVIMAIILVVVGTFFGLEYKGKKDIKPTVTQDVSYEEVIEYNGGRYVFDEDVIAIAFIGVDQRELVSISETDFVGCADADIVVTVDTNDGTIKIIAVPRDTMVDVDQYSTNGIYLNSRKMQLCLAYAYGDGKEQSCENVVTSLSRILYNVPIEKYFALDLDGVIALNDAVGGVTVESLYNFSDLGINVGDEVTLRGDMAEAYIRTRDMEELDASINRTQRQVQYVKAFAQQVAPAIMRDFGTVSELYNTASNYSQTNLTLSNATYLASLVLSKGVSNFETYSIQGEMKESKETEYDDVVYAEFYPDSDSVMETILEVFYDKVD